MSNASIHEKSGESLAEALASPLPDVRVDAIEHAKTLNAQQIQRALSDPDFTVQAEVIRRADVRLTEKQIQAALESPWPLIRRLILSRPNTPLTRAQFDAAVNDSRHDKIVTAALSSHFEFELTPVDILSALKGEDSLASRQGRSGFAT